MFEKWQKNNTIFWAFWAFMQSYTHVLKNYEQKWWSGFFGGCKNEFTKYIWEGQNCPGTKYGWTWIILSKKYNFLGKLGVQRAIILIKCFVSHRPPPRKGGSVSRAQKKKKEWTDDCILNLMFSLQDIIRWQKMYINSTIKCLKRLRKWSINDNLRQLVLIRQDRVLVN